MRIKKSGKWICVLMLLLLVFSPDVAAKSKYKLTKSSIVLKKTQEYRLSLKGVSAKKVKWSSSNKKVATVNQGVITTYKAGNVVITARFKKKAYRCKVRVVSLNQDLLTIAKGTSYQLKASNGKNTKWTSSNNKIVAVNAKGKITAKKTGKAVIKCNTAGKVLKATVYVPSINASTLRLAINQGYQLVVANTGHVKTFASSNNNVATVSAQGYITTIQPGTATITCTSGKAALKCKVTVIAPDNLTTPMADLPQKSKVDRQTVTINAYPNPRTYTVYKQSATVNKNSGKNGVLASYMPNHGCAACCTATVLAGMTGKTFTPVSITETVEKKVFGETAWKANYSKAASSQCPITLYGISLILNKYNVSNRYVRHFPGANVSGDTAATAAAAKNEIYRHLKTGNPVIIEVSKTNWVTKVTDNKWSNSYHTLVILGMTNTGKAIVADPANRSSFGNQQRLKYVTLEELVQYMFSCTKYTSTSVYWNGKSVGGGYILVNPQS